MRKFSLVIMVVFFAACGNGSADTNTDSSSAAVDTSFSGSAMNTDTTSVIGSNHIGHGQMRTDTPMQGSNVGK